MKKRRGLLGNALQLGLLSFLSSALGFLREILIVRRFGASPATDGYIAAYSLPVTLFALTFGAGLSLALVPELTAADAAGEHLANRRFGEFLSLAIAPAVVISAFLILFRTALIRFFTPGLVDSPAASGFLAELSPVYFLTLVATAFGAWQCARHATWLFGMLNVMQNAVLVLGIGIFGGMLGIESLIWFTLGGYLVSFFYQLFMAKRAGFAEPFSTPRPSLSGMQLLLALLPFMATLGIGGDSGTAQGEVILARYFGSMLEGGTITLLALGNKLAGMPAVLIGAALGTALLPAASRAARGGDAAALGGRVRLALTTGALLTAPLVVLYADAPQLVASVILAGRSLRPAQLNELVGILRAFAPAIAGWTLVFVLSNALAATGAATFLVVSGVIAIVAGAIMMKFFSVWYGASGIAFSVSFCSIFYVLLMGARLMKNLASEGGFLRASLLQPVAIIVAGAVGMHFLIVATAGLVSLLVVAPLAFLLYAAWSMLNRDRLHVREVFST